MQPLAEMYQKLIRRIERCEATEQIQKIGIKLKFRISRQTTIERQHPELCFQLSTTTIGSGMATWSGESCQTGRHPRRIKK